jgi:hypothetical protein
MSNFLTEFQETRNKYNELRAQAEKAMQGEFSEALDRAAQIQKDFSDEFGGKLKLPASVLRFVVNTAKTRKKRASKTPVTITTPAAAPDAGAAAMNPPSGRKLAGLRKSFKSLTEKIAAAKAEGKPTRDLEDNLYQVNDELRLAGIAAETLTPETPAAVIPPLPPPQASLGPVHPF